MTAIEFTGQRIVLRQPEKLFFVRVALVVDPDDALNPRRLARVIGEPAPAFLDPDHRRRGVGANAILDTVRHAFAEIGHALLDRTSGQCTDHRLARQAGQYGQAKFALHGGG